MTKHDLLWLVVRVLGVYYLVQAVLILPHGGGLHVFISAVLHALIGYYLLARGALLFKLAGAPVGNST